LQRNPPECLQLNWQGFKMNDIVLVKDKTYTLAEVVDTVKQALDAVSKESEQNTLRYSTEDVYWLLYDILRYVNRNVRGEFALAQIKKGTYRVTYNAEETEQREAGKKLRAEVRQTADYLAELTGRRPPWG